MLKIWPLGLVAALMAAYLNWQGQGAGMQLGAQHIEPFQEAQPHELRLLAFGDYGTGSPQQEMVMALAERRCQTGKLDGILLLGDNIYMDGVQSIHDPKWQQVIEKPFAKPCLSKVPLYPILGNHDYKGNGDAQIQYSEKNPQWKFPSRFYSIFFGGLLEVVALDTNYADLCFDPSSCVINFALQRLQNPRSKWQIAIGHHPVQSSSSKHKRNLQGILLKPLVCRFDAYISGHSHHLEHLQSEACHGDLFVSGAGGASLYPVLEQDEDSQFAQATYGLLELSVREEAIHYSFYDHEGRSIYQYIRQAEPSLELSHKG